MPTYEFQCQECGTKQDLFLSIKSSSKPRPLACKSCNRETVHDRLIGSGSGFTGAAPFKPFEATTVHSKPEYLRRSDGSVVIGKNGRPVITKLNFPKIESKQQLREVAAGAWNGEKYEVNQL